MAEGLSTDKLLTTLSTIAEHAALIPRMEQHLSEMNGSIQECAEDIEENRKHISDLEAIEAARGARWKVVLGSALKIIEALLVAGALRIIITH